MKQRLDYIVYFRAVAIILIVSGHSVWVVDVKFVNIIDYGLVNIITGGTALFVFISGFLFQYLYAENFQYESLLISRFKRILLPYIFMTLVAEIIFRDGWSDRSIIALILKDLFFGDTFQAYWYVPFILTVYIFSPAYLLFSRQTTSVQLVIVVISLFISSLIQRPVGNDYVFQSLAFYCPIYLVGMMVADNRESLLPILRSNIIILVLTTLLFVGVQSLNGQTDNMHKAFFSWGGIDFMGIQKVALSLTLISIFSFIPVNKNGLLNLISETSFAIFFIHPFILKLSYGTKIFQITGESWVDMVFSVTVVVIVSVSIALMFRYIFKGYSKFFCGY